MIMNYMKYIMFDNGMYDVPVIFSNAEDHGDTARPYLNRGWQVLSAGMIDFSPEGLRCYGDSHSLKVKARPEDSDIVNRMIGARDYD